ncbi:MAG: flagellar basal body-associated FliL family protein [Deltaproteobacteria bacterium]|nr:flagellar basal body-associated FliL family protein [Deltaproteobacteria bacterium]
MPEYDFSDFGGIADDPPAGQGASSSAPVPSPGEAPPSAGGGMKKLMPILVPLVAALAGVGIGAGVMVFMGGSGDTVAAAPAEAPVEEPAAVQEVVPTAAPPPPPQRQNTVEVYDLRPFTINLRGGGGGRVLRLTCALQVDAGYVETLEKQDAEVRDAINILVSDYTWSELEGLDGKNRLRDELLGRLNSVFAGQIRVDRIYFTEFVVQ